MIDTRKILIMIAIACLAIYGAAGLNRSMALRTDNHASEKNTSNIFSGAFLIAEGTASFYADRFHGNTTANGERFDMHGYTAAHRSLPFGTLVRVTNPDNGRNVIVRINDRGPYRQGRIIDLSLEAARSLGLLHQGIGTVKIEAFEPLRKQLISG
jgi:rare lipoprotein A